MKRITVFVLIAIGFLSCQMNQKEIQYLSTTLSPYSEEMGIIPNSLPREIFQIETYAKLETGLEDCLVYFGVLKQGETPFHWLKVESLLGNSLLTMDFKKDESLNIHRDTIKYKFNTEASMIVFEIIHHLSTNEIQYIWLDENNKRSEKAVVIPLDHPLKEGKIFPDLTVEQLNSEKLSFNDFEGKYVVVNWWQITCAPCVAEMPGFNKLVEQYKENPNITFIAIAHNSKEDVSRFLENREFNYIQTLANKDAVKLFGEAYPVSLIINPEGKICSYSKGGHADKYLEIEKILNDLLD